MSSLWKQFWGAAFFSATAPPLRPPPPAPPRPIPPKDAEFKIRIIIIKVLSLRLCVKMHKRLDLSNGRRACLLLAYHHHHLHHHHHLTCGTNWALHVNQSSGKSVGKKPIDHKTQWNSLALKPCSGLRYLFPWQRALCCR